jgi:hypothetical protein
MAAEIIADMDCDWQSVLATQSGEAPQGQPVWYQKHMPHHMVGTIDIRDMPDHAHAFLIRAPERVVASYRNKNELNDPEALGFARIREYFEIAAERTGRTPAVVDSDAVLRAPKETLAKLCGAIGIAWDDAMLNWELGPLPDDGIWGVHWYDKVNASTGFGAAPGDLPPLEGDYAKVAEACRADYEYLLQFAL